MIQDTDALFADLKRASPLRRFGRVTALGQGSLSVAGLGRFARLGDQVEIRPAAADPVGGEVIALNRDHAIVMTYQGITGLAISDHAALLGECGIRPDASWTGRILDGFGQPLDGRPLQPGPQKVPFSARPPEATTRKRLGPRLETGLAVFNTILPIARGQRIGIFSGSGVGKSMLLGDLARGVSADIVVLALIGERGRELRDFVEIVLGPEGMRRTILVVATSDQSPLVKRRAAWTAMAIAEHFRDHGRHVLFMIDSITRFAEAHREVALTAGETPGLRAYPPSTANLIAAFAERAGPGREGTGDITALMSVLVAGSDMEEPVADITRSVLDGHVILDRAIAERGRFPAIDVRRSVSRALPAAASAAENAIIAGVRRALGTWFEAEAMIHTGLYPAGSNAAIDEAIRLAPLLDQFFARKSSAGSVADFAELGQMLQRPTPQPAVRAEKPGKALAKWGR